MQKCEDKDLAKFDKIKEGFFGLLHIREKASKDRED